MSIPVRLPARHFSAKCIYLSIFNLSASRNRRPFSVTGDCTHTLHPPPSTISPPALHPGCPTRLLNLYIFTHCRCTRAATTGCASLSSLPSWRFRNATACDSRHSSNTPLAPHVLPVTARPLRFLHARGLRYTVGICAKLTKGFYTAASLVPPMQTIVGSLFFLTLVSDFMIGQCFLLRHSREETLCYANPDSKANGTKTIMISHPQVTYYKVSLIT